MIDKRCKRDGRQANLEGELDANVPSTHNTRCADGPGYRKVNAIGSLVRRRGAGRARRVPQLIVYITGYVNEGQVKLRYLRPHLGIVEARVKVVAVEQVADDPDSSLVHGGIAATHPDIKRRQKTRQLILRDVTTHLTRRAVTRSHMIIPTR